MNKSESYEAQFNKWLDPFMVMLAARKNSLPLYDWLILVERTKNSIIQNPSQYLGHELPASEVIENSVSAIFSDFLRRLGEAG